MKCPMTFGDPCNDRDEECREDCAWLLVRGTCVGEYKVCSIAMLASSGTESSPVNIKKGDA